MISYKLKIDNPATHRISIAINGPWPADQEEVTFSMPVWAPGSYLVREYAKNVITLKATSGTGEVLFSEKVRKNSWTISRDKSQLNGELQEFHLEYEVYCFEVSVRNSFINQDHAFLHLPDLLMFSEDFMTGPYGVTVDFPPCWSKIHTGLEDVSQGAEFKYQATDYDELIDTPIEIGCHDSTGFNVDGTDYHVAAFGKLPKTYRKVIDDMKTVTKAVCDFWSDVPYKHYTYITHFIPSVYGGLEHHNSTVMQFDPFELETRSGHLNYLGLVCHEFFHTWNVKRIRPQELVNFDYHNENYTKMHWLTEGLTSFVDDALLLSCGVSEAKEYADTLLKSLQRLEATAGRKFLSLEESSFDTWIKLYRPNENSANSNISYYLKGDLVFFCLNAYLLDHGKNIKDFCTLLWQAYKDPKYNGISKEMVLSMITELSDRSVAEKFDEMISTTKDLPLDECARKVGLELVRSKDEGAELGVSFEFKDQNLWIKSIALDSAAYKCGLNAKDELIAADGVRINQKNYQAWMKTLQENQKVNLTVSRFGELREINFIVESKKEKISEVKIVNEEVFTQAHRYE